MPLNVTVLGNALYDARQVFNDKTLAELIDEYESLEGVRRAMCNADAEAIINHITVNGLVTVPGTGLVASGGGAVTGTASGTIS